MKIISNTDLIQNRMTSNVNGSPNCVICKHQEDFYTKTGKKKPQDEHHDCSQHHASPSPVIRVRQDIYVTPPPPPSCPPPPPRSCLKSRTRRFPHACDEIEILLPGAKRPITRTLSVQFNEGVMVRKMRPTKSLTDKPEQLWFQDAELERIKKQVMTLVEDKKRYAELEDSDDDDDDDSLASEPEVPGECTRGLERMLEPEKAKVMKFQAWDTVSNEQFLQRQEKDFDPEAMAEVYSFVTRRSAREALRRATKDAEEIQGYLRSTRRTCRKLSI